MFQTTNLFFGGQYDGYLDAAVEKKKIVQWHLQLRGCALQRRLDLSTGQGEITRWEFICKTGTRLTSKSHQSTNQPANQAAPEASRLNHYYKIYHESNSPKQTIARGFALHSILPGEHTIVDTEDMLSGLKWDNKNTQKHRSHFPGRSCIDFHMAYAHT